MLEPQDGRVVVTEVAQEPPQPRRPARALVVADDERSRPDARPRSPAGELVHGRERVPAAALTAGQVALGVGVGGAGDVTGEVRLTGTAVDEAGLHPASVQERPV